MLKDVTSIKLHLYNILHPHIGIVSSSLPEVTWKQKLTTPSTLNSLKQTITHSMLILKPSTVPDENGNFKEFRIAVTDINDLKNTEKALKESEERYREIFFNNHTIMILIDPSS